MKDREDIPPEQTKNLANYDIASSQQTQPVEADTVEPKTSSTPTETSSPGSDRPRPTKWRVLQVSLVLLVLISTVTGIIVVPRFYRTYTAVKSTTSQTLPHVKTTGQPIPSPTSLPNDLVGLDHLNLLLLGSDTDSKFEGGRVLTQTDIVVRIDLAHHHVTMLSLPRDLWVPSDEGYCCAKLDAHFAQRN